MSLALIGSRFRKLENFLTFSNNHNFERSVLLLRSETRHWEEGQCLLYDTTYEHETFNSHPTEERVVLHVDFFNTLKMTKLEIDVLQYIYDMREQFMKAEGVAKVGAQVL